MQLLVKVVFWRPPVLFEHRLNAIGNSLSSLSTEARSERMSRVRGKNTGPELTVRRLIHGLGAPASP